MNLKSLWADIPRPARIYLGAVGGVAVAGVAVVATVAATGMPLLAASPSPSPSASASPGASQAYCNAFIGHLASNLGKSQDQVKKALSDAVSQTLNDAVKKGDLTQKQADAIKSRLGGSQVCAAGIGDGIAHIGKEPGKGARISHIGGASLAENAKALGISEQELRQNLQSGKTVKDIAASKGMDETAFRSKLVGVTKADLDKQVSAGNLTQKQEDAILQRLQNDPLPLWDRTPKLPARPSAPSPKPTPSAT